MSRLPFNPDRLPDLDMASPVLREQKRPMTVTQASELIKRVLADRTPSPIRIVGEVSNFIDRGHWYLSLKDEANVICCVMWATAARGCGFIPARGQQVVATGRLDFYGPQGKLQLYIDAMEPVGQGVLELRFRRLCEELRAAGYFDAARKRPMPRFPEHIALVTSASGAALQDVVRTARNRWAGVALSLFNVRVQGEGAAEEIARAVTLLSEQHERLRIDAVILTRGGGSMEDLWAFNERVVADAVFRSRVPIAVGVGHETDTTIAELVADLRCSTPTQTAGLLVPDAATERHRIDQVGNRLAHCLRRRGEVAAATLDGLARHAIFRRPLERLERLHQRLRHGILGLTTAMRSRVQRMGTLLDSHRHAMACIEPVTKLSAARQRLELTQRRVPAAMERHLQSRWARLAALERQLEAVGAQSVLKRGYTYTTDAAGQLLRTATAARAAQSLVTHFADGEVRSHIHHTPAPPAPIRKRKHRKSPSPGGEPVLFDP